MTLKIAKVKIRGTRPFLFHNFNTDILALNPRDRELTGVAGNNPDEWKDTYTADENNQLYIRGTNVFFCLRNAAKYVKEGRTSIQTNLSPALQVLTDRVYFNRYMPEELTRDETQPVYLDVRGVKNPNTRGRNVRYRVALSPGWETEFEFIWENSLVSTRQIKNVLLDAGTLVGLGDGRAIGFGRFKIISLEIDTYNEGMNKIA